MKFNAQGTIEYLVILAIVVVVSLIVVSFISGFAGSDNIVGSSNQIQSNIGSQGISVIEAVATEYGEGIINLRNNGSDIIKITKISTNSGENQYTQTIPIGASALISLNEISLGCNCENGQKAICEFEIYYLTSNDLEKKVSQKVTLDCVEEVIPIKPELVVQPNTVFLNENCFNPLDDPIKICTLSDLNRMRDYLDMNFELQADIDATGTNEWDSGKGWDPIGIPNTTYFIGSLEGNNKKIINLTINRPTEHYVGLFGQFGGDSISNLYLIDVNVVGQYRVGGVAGEHLFGTFENIHVSGEVFGRGTVGGLIGEQYYHYPSILNCSSSVNIFSTGTDSFYGGIAGVSWGDINNCYSTGNIYGVGFSGGLVGESFSRIFNSYSTGEIFGTNLTGGLVGYAYNDIVNCYSTGNISGTSYVGGLGGGTERNVIQSFSTGDVFGTTEYVGGLLGVLSSNPGDGIYNSYSKGNVQGYQAAGLVGLNWSGDVTNSYSVGEVIGTSTSNGLISFVESGNIINSVYDTNTSKQTDTGQGIPKTTIEMKQQSTFVDWDFETVWVMPSNDYPKLAWE